MIIGVVNHEYEPVTYRVVIRLENMSIAIINDVILEQGEGWERNYTFMPDMVGERMKLEFLLYKDGLNETYRNLYLWVTIRS